MTVKVDGVTVLDGRGQTDTTRVTAKAPLKRDAGSLHVRGEVPLAGGRAGPAAALVGGRAFAREPLPAWRLGHTAAEEARPAAWVRDPSRAAAGSRSVEFGCARCHAGAFPG